MTPLFVLSAAALILPPLAWMWRRDARLNAEDDARDREVAEKLEACRRGEDWCENTAQSLLDGLRDSGRE